MTIQFVPRREYCPADYDTLRRRLQSDVEIDTGSLPGESSGNLRFVDLQSGVRLVAVRRFRRVTTLSGFPKGLTFIHIPATIAEDGCLYNSLFRRKVRISLPGL